jgi:(p)ppGpp synthase/HD superfamily hydrolase
MKQIALNIIETAFAGKKDKGGKPYIEHLKRVSENAKNYFSGQDYILELEVIGLLHDLLEDCPEWTKKHLESIFKDALVVDAIQRLTKRSDLNYEQYIENIKGNRFSRAVKLADLKDNMDLTRLSELSEEDIERVKKYHKSYVYLLGDGRF